MRPVPRSSTCTLTSSASVWTESRPWSSSGVSTFICLRASVVTAASGVTGAGAAGTTGVGPGTTGVGAGTTGVGRGESGRGASGPSRGCKAARARVMSLSKFDVPAGVHVVGVPRLVVTPEGRGAAGRDRDGPAPREGVRTCDGEPARAPMPQERESPNLASASMTRHLVPSGRGPPQGPPGAAESAEDPRLVPGCRAFSFVGRVLRAPAAQYGPHRYPK